MNLVSQKRSTFSLVLQAMKYLPNLRRALPLIFLLMIAGIACIIAEPYIYKILFDKIELIGRQMLPWAQAKHDFLVILSIWWGVTVFASVFGFLHGYLLDVAGSRDWTAYLTQLGASYLSLPYAKIIEKNAGSHQSVYSRSGWSILRIAFQIVGGVFYHGLLALAMIVLGLYIDWKITMIALIITPVYVFLSWYIGKKANEAYEKTMVQVDLLFGRFSDILTNIMAVRIFGGFHRSFGEIRSHADVLTRESTREEILWSLLRRSTELVDALGRVFVLAAGVLLVARSQMSLGEVVLFLTIMNRISAPISRVLDSIRWMTEYFVDLEKALDVLGAPKEIDTGTQDFVSFKNSIEFQNVSFAYPESERKILSDISLSIKKWQKVAFVGHTGSGKSTITKLFARLYDIEDGVICIDGIDIQAYTLDSYRKKTAMVFQETTLFSDTIRYNLLYAKPDVTDDELRTACARANILDFIDWLEKGLETEVWERGLKLSGGEKQRISIARAILANPEILILDEPTSALDSATEQGIQTALDTLMQDRTSIIIAHRLSTIQHADRIFLLDHGRLIGQGTHAELYAASEKYREMVDYQKNGFIA